MGKTWQCAKCLAIISEDAEHDCDGRGALLAGLFKAESDRAATADREAAESACPECAELRERVAELERAINRLGGSPPFFPVTFAQLARVQEARIAELECELTERHGHYQTQLGSVAEWRQRAEKAEAKAAQYERDWREAKAEFGVVLGKRKERLMEAERERDEALAKLAALGVDKRSGTEKGGADEPG